jgi:hypothetical protein
MNSISSVVSVSWLEMRVNECVPIADWIDGSAILTRNKQLLWLGASLQVKSRNSVDNYQSANQMNAFHQRSHRNFPPRRQHEHLSLLLEVSDSF